MNKTILTGRLTREPKEFINKDGSKTVMFTIAINNGDNVSYIPCNAFVKANVKKTPFDFMPKGRFVEIEGYLKNDVYKKDGETVNQLKIMVSRVQLGALPKYENDAVVEHGEPIEDSMFVQEDELEQLAEEMLEPAF